MLAGPLPPRVGHIIAERHPVLRVILDALTAADQANEGTADLLVEVGSLDGVGIRGTRLAPIVLEADGRFVEPAPAGVPMLSDPRIDVVSDVVRRLEARNATEVPYVRFVPKVHAQLQRLGRRRHVGQLPKRERRAEGRDELPVVLRQIHSIEGRVAPGRRRGVGVERDRVRAVLIVALIGSEEEQPVLHDRPSDAQACLITGILRLGRVERQGVGGDQAFPLPVEERRSLPPVAARLGSRSDERARGLLVLRFVVLRDNAKLLNRIQRERSEEHTSELQSRLHLVCRLLLEKKKKKTNNYYTYSVS